MGRLLGDSFAYTKDGLLGNPVTWIVLIVLSIMPVIPFGVAILVMLPSLMTGTIPDIWMMAGVFLVALIAAVILGAFSMGYMLKIFRGEVPLPAVTGFGTMFTDGIRYLAIEIIYAIPVLLILGATIGGAIMAALSAGPDIDMETLFPIIGGALAGVFVAMIAAFIIGLIATIGIVRFARTGRIGEAFNFSAILGTIRGIGWGSYILALVIGVVIIVVVQLVLGSIPYIGGFIQLIIAPFITVFFTRYVTLIYESGEPGVPAPA